MPLQSANLPDQVMLSQWAGVNQSSPSRSAINDQETFWQENFFPYAPGQIRAGYGPSAAIYTAPAGSSILRMFFGRVNDSQGPTALMFLNTGVVHQVLLNTGAVTALGTIWSPLDPYNFASAKVWQPQQVGYTTGTPGGWVIGSTAGLYAWDGATLTAPGQAAPAWLTNGQTTTMPTVGSLPGIWAMAVWQNRLWVIGKTVLSWSAPYNGADFSTANGGGSVAFVGDQLTVGYTDLEAAGGFLYLFGDSMINVISALQLSGSGTITAPFTTTFLNSNVDPQIGHRWWRPAARWSQSFALSTGMGIYLLQANTTQWVSQKVTEVYNSTASSPVPTGTAATIFGQRWLLFLGQMRDPYGVTRSLILCFNGSQWVIASQRYALTLIGAYEEQSMITPYGTDGTSLYRLFAQPDPALVKQLLTKAYKGQHNLAIKTWKRVYAELRDYHGGPQGVSVIGTITTGGGGIPNGTQAVSFQMEPAGYNTVPQPTDGAGLWASLDLVSQSPDFAIESLSLTYEERTLFGA